MHLINCGRIKKDLGEAGFQCIDGELLRLWDCTSQKTYVIALAMNHMLNIYKCMYIYIYIYLFIYIYNITYI